MTTITRPELEAFLYAEARALDDRDWDTWLTFYAPDVRFWMPAWDDDDCLVENPQTDVSLIYYPAAAASRIGFSVSKPNGRAPAPRSRARSTTSPISRSALRPTESSISGSTG
nr:aromatic-ring-hydroxylating dioxygenase subunit beta [Bradyrhizobium sp. CCBAU 51765]